MKALYLSTTLVMLFFATALKAQKKAELDNNTRITVVRTEKVTGKTKEVHYVMTNSSNVSMDFSLYKQLNNGSWDITHHMDLKPGQAYEDVSGFTGVNGKYVLFSAPHSDWASFPSFTDIDKALAANPGGLVTAAPSTTNTATTTTNTTSTPSQTSAPKQSPATTSSPSPANSPSNNNDAPPVPPPM
ncbi:hypothetical protein [Mucilaginibacter ginsenosidivorans]|uniref:Uncharacterized protein n=1 Tax=Mucilaginibacter ginsenosidivorans TaxID=398053 RepID=A0A5B8V0G4_9SPHI|nr:hypothetical protein [Mucilaginibacter ginsenosidivorans]QEC64688.1 hypothetical protein FRZ54_19670 [Mucilaginibacter ginsenosidivorans]